MDRTKELDQFVTSIQDILAQSDLGELVGGGTLDEITRALTGVGAIAEEHKTIVGRQRQTGLPVRRQH